VKLFTQLKLTTNLIALELISSGSVLLLVEIFVGSQVAGSGTDFLVKLRQLAPEIGRHSQQFWIFRFEGLFDVRGFWTRKIRMKNG
jgi:hypothetical protein